MLNAFVGWYQEKQAGDIVEQLKAGIAMKATVRPYSFYITSSLADVYCGTCRLSVRGKSKKSRLARSFPVMSWLSKRGRRSLLMGKHVYIPLSPKSFRNLFLVDTR